MQLSIILAVTAVAVVGNCYPGGGGSVSNHGFQKPSPRDRRSPCPMLNALANHGWLPRSGFNVSIDQVVNGIDLALNLSPQSSRPVAELAQTTSTTGNPTTFHLDDLNKHGIIEHDGSLSRNDIIFGDNHSFNKRIFDSYFSAFAGLKVISISAAANARRARHIAARAVNPVFNYTAREDQFSQFETALYLSVFGTGTEGNAPTRWVEVMFREERIPYKEGYRRPTDVVTNDDIVELANKINAAAPVPY
ncbi:Chloroperoxidase [Podospora appendiculata]|uniref:Chloroperoxidase n=1 Tax=Podospora appendiculata TaxID=314037 RepID=A0AAE0X068_9PEZI|nr:Chloroperoxidase [Podospora appendiculata]